MIKFSHPNATSPTTEISLGNIEQFPVSRPLRRLQSAYDTDAGVTVIYDWGDSVRAFTINLWPLTQVQADDLEDFFSVTANGRANSWDYTDSRGLVRTVRFAQDVFEAQERVFGRLTVTLTLREV